jgi:hypothetical protein
LAASLAADKIADCGRLEHRYLPTARDYMQIQAFAAGFLEKWPQLPFQHLQGSDFLWCKHVESVLNEYL